MKIALFIIITIGLTAFGNSFSKKYKDKLIFYKDLNAFCNVLENQIKFHKSTLEQIVKLNLESFNVAFKQLVYNFFVLKKPYENILLLTQKENAFVKNFFESLGKLDSQGEVNNIHNNKTQIKRLIEEKTEDVKKFAPLGTKLGFIAGLLICIVLI